MFDGYGIQTWYPFIDIISGLTISGRRYEGEFYMGKKHGKGAYFSGDGLSYVGMFSRGMYHGYGVLRNSLGDTFNGNFVNSKPSGQQLIEYTNKNKYEGEMLMGLFQGHGKFTWCNDAGYYEGDWVRGKFHGNGNEVLAL